MPSDSNGVYSLPDGYEAVTGETIQASQHNPPLEDLASAMSARLMRTGVAPMTGALKVIDGAVGSPAVQFSSDSGTGFYKTPNGFGVAVGGSKVAEFTAGGISLYLGLLLPFTMLTAPAGWVLPYGQTLSRTTYAAMWAAVQTEIANGNTFYNNGNGTTTFGIGDMRGCVPAGKDDMSGLSASRLLTSFGSNNVVLGAFSGHDYEYLTQAMLPAVAPTFTGTQGNVSVKSSRSTYLSGNTRQASPGSGVAGVDVGSQNYDQVESTGVFTPAGTISNLGSGDYHITIQPTVITNYILYVGA